MSQSQPSSSSALPAASSSGMGSGTDLESVISEITTSSSPPYLLDALRNLVKRDVGETILASVLPGGHDPLTVLDAHTNTLGFLFILSARLSIAGAPPVTFHTIFMFCRNFDPEQARLAPDRVNGLARGIIHFAESHNILKAAISPMYELTTRYTPSLWYLTTLHTQFLHACVASHHYTHALPVLSVPISEIDTSLSPLTYHDVIDYHYTGALALLALKRFSAAATYLEAVVAAPAQQHPAALQLEAFKKLTLVQLIIYGTTKSPPKYTHPNLWRYLKNTPYAAFAKAYGSPATTLRELVDKEASLFETERNLGLVQQAVAHAPRWAVRKLTATYLTLSLAEIGKAVGIADDEAVREVVLSMIERGEMEATLDAAGTVTFLESETRYSGVDVDRLLRDVQMQGATLGELDREVGRSKEFLTKAVKEKDGGGVGLDEMDLYGSGPPPGYRDWDEGGF